MIDYDLDTNESTSASCAVGPALRVSHLSSTSPGQGGSLTSAPVPMSYPPGSPAKVSATHFHVPSQLPEGQAAHGSNSIGSANLGPSNDRGLVLRATVLARLQREKKDACDEPPATVACDNTGIPSDSAVQRPTSISHTNIDPRAVEARLRTRAQLQVRLAAEKKSARF
ncbi:hypothetical protein BD779DRAFT_768969 [Infundibulicybe gibba]|nr:hypothetical protein BD779DRAFT_768969 [Infundibulicybe gibba]